MCADATDPRSPNCLSTVTVKRATDSLSSFLSFFLLYFLFWLAYTAIDAEEKKGVVDWAELTGRERQKESKLVHAVFRARSRPELWSVKRSDQSRGQLRLTGLWNKTLNKRSPRITQVCIHEETRGPYSEKVSAHKWPGPSLGFFEAKAKTNPLCMEFCGGGEPLRELRFPCFKEVSHVMGPRSSGYCVTCPASGV